MIEDTIDSITFQIVDPQCLKGKKINYLNGSTLNGSFYSMDQDSAAVYLIYLWFSKCPPCIAAFPILNSIYEDYKEDPVRFLSICKDDITTESEFLVRHEFKWNHLMNSHDSIRAWFPPTGFPTMYIVNQNHKIMNIKIGGSSTKDLSVYNDIKANIDRILHNH